MRAKLNKRTVDAQHQADRRITIWDTELPGFGLRVSRTGERTYVVKLRVCGRQRWVTIGRHGPWTPELARREAFRVLSDAARGLDPYNRVPQDRTLTVADLCDLYVTEGSSHKKESTRRSDTGRIEHHIKPLLGALRVIAVSRGDIERLLQDIISGRTAVRQASGMRRPGSIPAGGKGAASRSVELLGTLFSFAIGRGLRSDNPVHGIKKPKGKKLERFLSASEFGKLAESLEEEKTGSGCEIAVAAIRLLALTGCRRGELLSLHWQHVDIANRCLRLPDSKTGAKIVHLSAPAISVLQKLPRNASNPHVFFGRHSTGPLVGIDKIWARVRGRAGLKDVRLHDLRHSFASVAVAEGLGLPIVGALLGHRHTATTARYAHLAADPVRAANEAIGERISAAMSGRRGLDL
jgi:integrase